MNTSSADRDKQLGREALFALSAIVLSLAFLLAVACWRFGVFSEAGDSSTPEFGRKWPKPTAPVDTFAGRSRSDRAAPIPSVSPADTSSPASSPWKPRASQADFREPSQSGQGGYTPRVAPASAPVGDPRIASLPSPYESTTAPLEPPRQFDESLPAQPLTTTPTSYPVREPQPLSPTGNEFEMPVERPPTSSETEAADAHRVASGVLHRRVTPFAEDERREERKQLAPTHREPVVEDRPPTRLEAPSAYPPVSAPPPSQQEASASEDSVIVAPDDTFWTISVRVYGTGDFYKALYHHNRDRFRRPDRLPIGARVAVPSAAELRQLYPALAPLAVQ
ncbi:MAG: hypothetical protein RIC55_08510 [Pirellulaceae bacterium]